MNKFLIDRKLIRQIDFGLLFVAILIAGFGAVNIYSATYKGSGSHTMIAQLVNIALGLVVAYGLMLFDYALIGNFSEILYWIGVGLLLYTDIFAKAINGARSWIKIFGVISVEPGEIIKIALILLIAKKIYSMDGKVNNFKNLMIIALYTIIPVAFILKEPNVGLAIICLCIVFGMLFISKLDLRIIFGIIITCIVVIAIAWHFNLLKDYQKTRITSLFGSSSTSSDSTLQADNSVLGIGAGGIFGEGFMKGTQVSGGYIPEDQTDMIFSVVGEEWGLIGTGALLILYMIMLWKILKISMQSKDLLGKLICIGTFASLTFSIYQNVGMTLKIAPIAGITLPFMSYGGCSMLTNFANIGLVMNVGMRKKKINF